MKNLTKISDLDIETVEDLLNRAFRYKNLYSEGIRSENILEAK